MDLLWLPGLVCSPVIQKKSKTHMCRNFLRIPLRFFPHISSEDSAELVEHLPFCRRRVYCREGASQSWYFHPKMCQGESLALELTGDGNTSKFPWNQPKGVDICTQVAGSSVSPPWQPWPGSTSAFSRFCLPLPCAWLTQSAALFKDSCNILLAFGNY